ncbi:MAG: cytochrome c [Haliea sp.]|uniref:c-type cytochrome n=1 Tax=Haliea sp. TaxID=1932666 RepID=UPI0032ECA0F8
MPNPLRKRAAILASAAALAISPLALSHLDENEFHQSYRQSYFALLGANFGPIGAMVKGEMPWNQEQLQGFANDFAAVSTLNILRGFPEGSEKGTTRAQPEIWSNMEDFASKFDTLKAEAATLQTTVAGGDRGAIAQQVGAVGQACKACHDEYKSKDYLY